MDSTKTKIREIMIDKNINIETLSIKTKINKQKLHLLLNYDFIELKMSHVLAICKGLEINVSDIC